METYLERKKKVMQSRKRDISGISVYQRKSRMERNGKPVLKENEAEVKENV